MSLNILTAIAPIDGRYHNSTIELADYFSEFALIKYRFFVEVKYLEALNLTRLPALHTPVKAIEKLMHLHEHFSINDAEDVKLLEKTTHHDVKAMEYFIKQKLVAWNLHEKKELVHLGLTSQDINNTAIPLSIKEATLAVYFPLMDQLLTMLLSKASAWNDITMLAHTHGQPASPTRLGKEILVFHTRLLQQLDLLRNIPYAAKFGGATGNFNSLYAAYPEINWHQFADDFITNKLGLYRSFPTTQIEHYDHLASYFDNLKRINTILIDLCRDIWTYISMDYFKQKIKSNEVGSSAMPHKVNPIDFENAEGNLGIANALYEHFAAKLPISRMQRDLTDSTVLRNVGLPMAHTIIAFKNILRGMDKLILNESKINMDLEDNWVVIAEGIQTILKRHAYDNAYEELKKLTRTQSKITAQTFFDYIATLPVKDSVKSQLLALTPFNYIGQ